MAQVGILTHGDVDGICAAALVKRVYPEAKVEFAEPYELAPKLRELPSWGRAFILDLGIGVARKDEIKEAFRKASLTRELVYIDHHLLPPGINRRTLGCTFIHRTRVSASELTLEFFNLSSALAHVALLGAIGDYQEHTQRMRAIVEAHGWRRSYFEALLLEYALEASREDHEFKREVVQELSMGSWPSDILALIERAKIGIRLESEIEAHVRRRVQRVADKLALVLDVPGGATGKAADYALRLARAEVGIGTFKLSGSVRFSLRRDGRSELNLSTLVQRITSRVGGVGGGHDTAAGGLVPTQSFRAFLRELKQELQLA